jgi:hypothetical protein
MRARDDLRNALARVAAANEAFAAGDTDDARRILLDLERDLERGLDADRLPFACRSCRARFRWPGLRDHHELTHGHHREREAAA